MYIEVYSSNRFKFKIHYLRWFFFNAIFLEYLDLRLCVAGVKKLL